MKSLVRPPTLTAAVADAIREAILRGDLLPGEPLKEIDISKSLDTSRGTVREALRELQQSGLVEIFPYRGAFVTRLTPQKAWEISSLRALLESFAVRLALETNPYTQEDLNRLKEMVHRLGELEEKGDDFQAIVTTDSNFHRLICERCKHNLVLDVLNNLQSLTMLFILSTKLYRSDMERDEVSHQAVLNGILSGDPAIAEDILKRHILDSGKWLIRRLEEMQDQAPETAEPSITL